MKVRQFSIAFLGCIRFHHRESKVTEITVYSREDADISVPAGAFSQILQAICYRIANTSLNNLNEKKRQRSKIMENFKDNIP